MKRNNKFIFMLLTNMICLISITTITAFATPNNLKNTEDTPTYYTSNINTVYKINTNDIPVSITSSIIIKKNTDDVATSSNTSSKNTINKNTSNNTSSHISHKISVNNTSSNTSNVSSENGKSIITGTTANIISLLFLLLVSCVIGIALYNKKND